MGFEIDFLEFYDEGTIVAELQRLAGALGKQNVSAQDLAAHGRVKYHMVVNHFGSLRRALEAAKLKPSRCTKATDEELLKMVVELWTITARETGRRPSTGDLLRFGIPVSAATIINRFGTWKKALIEAAKTVSDKPVEIQKTPRKRRPIALSRRFLVLKRDQYRCRICNRAGVALEVDHILPLNLGGSDSLDNLQTACLDCNRGKSDRMQ
jgi:hypothetical protein